jgi:hypothetical protein
MPSNCGGVAADIMSPMSRPASFADEWMSEWSEWVLDHGLPDLPAEVAGGDAVPVAYWAGPLVGAVLHRWRRSGDELADDEVGEEVQHFRRTSHGWEEANGQGGSGGGIDPLLQRLAFPADYAFVGGETSTLDGHWSCSSIEGGARGWQRRPGTRFARRGVPGARLAAGAVIAATGDPAGATVVVVDGRGVELLRAPFGRSR